MATPRPLGGPHLPESHRNPAAAQHLPRLPVTVLWLTVRAAWRWPLVPALHLADGSCLG